MSNIRTWLAEKSSEEREHFLGEVPRLLLEGGQVNKLCRLLSDFDFIETKINHPKFGVQALIEDYDLIDDAPILTHPEYETQTVKALKLIQGALRLSAHILIQDTKELAGQLSGRLQCFELPKIQALLQQAQQYKTTWLRPLTPSLTPPDGILIRTIEGHTSTVSAVVVTPDGNKLVSASYDHSVKVWHLETGEQLLTFSGHVERVNAIAISPDGKLVFSGSSDKTIKVWDIENRNKILTFTGHADSITCLAVTPNGKRLISGSEDKTIKIWNLENKKELNTLEGHPEKVTSVVVTTDGRKIISSSWFGMLKVWNLETATEVFPFNSSAKFKRTITLTPNGKHLISASINTTFWNIETGQNFFTFYIEPKNVESSVEAMTVSQDGNLLISGLGNGTLKIWNLSERKELVTFKGHVGAVTSVVVTPDGKQMISASTDNTVKVWDLAKIHQKESLPKNQANRGITVITMTPDSKQVISGSDDGTITIWDLTTRNKLKTFTHSNYKTYLQDLVVTPDGQRFISASTDRTIKVWDLTTGKNINTFVGHTSQVITIAVTPDGKQLISGSADTTVKIWNLETGEDIYTLTGHNDYVLSVKVTPDGKQIISSSSDKTIVWNLETKEMLSTGEGNIIWGKKFAVVTPNKKWLIFISSNTLKVLDLKNQKIIASFTGESTLLCCAVAPDGVTIVAGEASGRLHFLRLEGIEA